MRGSELHAHVDGPLRLIGNQRLGSVAERLVEPMQKLRIEAGRQRGAWQMQQGLACQAAAGTRASALWLAGKSERTGG